MVAPLRSDWLGEGCPLLLVEDPMVEALTEIGRLPPTPGGPGEAPFRPPRCWSTGDTDHRLTGGLPSPSTLLASALPSMNSEKRARNLWQSIDSKATPYIRLTASETSSGISVTFRGGARFPSGRHLFHEVGGPSPVPGRSPATPEKKPALRKEGRLSESQVGSMVSLSYQEPHPQSRRGAMILAKLFRARFSRLFTVPRLHPVMSAISSYVFPSNSLRTNTIR